MHPLKDKVIIITGASAGIGKETALALGKEKAWVVLAARRRERLDEIAKQIEAAGGAALVVPTDVCEEPQVQNLVHTTLERFNRIDVLINNAGVGLVATLEETSSEQMERIWKTNFMSTFYGIRSTLPIMKKQGYGQILTISSVAGKRAIPLNTAYCSTKFAQVGLMESLRMELRHTEIRCTLVYPGATETEFLSVLGNPGNRKLKHTGPVQSPAEVAKAIVQAVKKPSVEVMTRWFGRPVVVVNAISPAFVDWIVGNIVKRKVIRNL